MNKHHKLLIAWFLISGLIVFTAVRQIQVAAASQIQAHQPLPPPAKTRHAIRPAVLPWSGDPVADYVARCGKGMTDREIRWALEDFRYAGLDRINGFTDKTPDAELIAYLAIQYHWYLGAVTDGLRLSPTQRGAASGKLGELFQTAASNFSKNREIEKSGLFTTLPTSYRNIFLETSLLMRVEDSDSDEQFMPWELCQLTPEQERLTWKLWFKSPVDSIAKKFDETKGPPRFWSPDPYVFRKSDPINPDWIHDAHLVLPLLANQKPHDAPPATDPLDDSGKTLLANIRLLHPAQFKLVLLFRPDLAEDIEGALEKSSH